MGALDYALTIFACPLSGNNREQILLFTVGANDIEQNVVCGNCLHVRVLLPRLPQCGPSVWPTARSKLSFCNQMAMG